MTKTSKVLISSVIAAGVGGGAYVTTDRAPEPQPDPNAWYFTTEPRLWVESEKRVWLGTFDVGVVDAGTVQNTLANHPYFASAIQRSEADFIERDRERQAIEAEAKVIEEARMAQEREKANAEAVRFAEERARDEAKLKAEAEAAAKVIHVDTHRFFVSATSGRGTVVIDARDGMVFVTQGEVTSGKLTIFLAREQYPELDAEIDAARDAYLSRVRDN